MSISQFIYNEKIKSLDLINIISEIFSKEKIYPFIFLYFFSKNQFDEIISTNFELNNKPNIFFGKN